MQSSLHGMIDKAHRYAEEPGRVRLARLEAFVRGDNNSEHAVTLSEGRLSCDCDHYVRARAHGGAPAEGVYPRERGAFPGQLAPQAIFGPQALW
jgi:hypothetical protein